MLVAATNRGVALVADETAKTVLASDARCLAAGGGFLYAGTEREGVFRSEDGGATWRPAGLAGRPVKSLAAAHGAVYAGTRPARVLVSRDAGSTWNELAPFPRLRSWWWFSPAEKPYSAYVLGLAVSPEDPGLLLAGIEAGAVLRSEDGGCTWSGHRRGAGRDCHRLVFAGAQRVYEASGTGGARISDDAGLTWRTAREGLEGGYGWTVAVDGKVAYLVAAPMRTAHSTDARACVYRAEGDEPWRRVLGPLGSLPALAAGARGEVFAAWAGELRVSRDAGQSWQQLRVDLGGRVRALLALH